MWAELGGHPTWQWLFESPDSPVKKRIAELETQLKNPAVREPEKIAHIRACITTLKWIGDLPRTMHAQEQQRDEQQAAVREEKAERQRLSWLPRVW